MRQFTLLCVLASAVGLVSAACPMLTGEMSAGDHANPHLHAKRGDGGDASAETEKFLSEFYLNDTDAYLTTDVGGPISDQNSLKAGIRGPTLLEDFIFRQKIQRFDHERVSWTDIQRHINYGVTALLIVPFYRFLNVPFMHEVPVLTAYLPLMLTGPT